MQARNLWWLCCAGFVVISINLFRMQVLRDDYYRDLSERNRIRVVYLEAPRGKILDRHGVVIATSRLSFNCSAIPSEAGPTIRQSCQRLSALVGIKAPELERRFFKRRSGSYSSAVLVEDLPASQAMAIEEILDLLPGFMIETRALRQYPFGEVGAHLLGYVGPMTQDEENFLEDYGYQRMDWVGRDGVEKLYESYLHGTSGGLQIEIDNRGRFVRALGVREPKEGKDIQLTLDANLQVYAQDLLKDQRGAILVMDIKDGGMLAMVSSPSYDPNFFASSRGRKEVGRFLRGAGSPMMNRSIQGQYPPGSIFKIVTALAGLEKRKITPRTSYHCPGYAIVGGLRFNCWAEAGHGPQDMTRGFAHSCDVFFYNTGMATGIDALAEKAIEFGFSKLTGIDLPSEKKGLVPTRDWKRKARKENWYEGDTVNLAIGQGYLLVTPVQSLVMITAAATQGVLIKPHIIDKIQSVSVAEKHTKGMTVKKQDWQAVREGLSEVVNSESGTGRLARAPGVRIAGKTGTAETGQSKTHAWFAGYAPEQDPEIAMVVFLEHGGRGGVAAAQVASKLFQWLKEASYL